MPGQHRSRNIPPNQSEKLAWLKAKLWRREHYGDVETNGLGSLTRAFLERKPKGEE